MARYHWGTTRVSGNLIFIGLIVAVVLLMVFAELGDRRHHRRRLQQQKEKIRRRVAELQAPGGVEPPTPPGRNDPDVKPD